jgi:hypothetical protein
MTHEELLALIDQAADEGWTELDLSGQGLTQLFTDSAKVFYSNQRFRLRDKATLWCLVMTLGSEIVSSIEIATEKIRNVLRFRRSTS